MVGASLKRTRQALMASDHLPLIADLKIGFGPA
jgi:endonuclease/exonuclease/phosphatase family metal-dependent hydrolase